MILNKPRKALPNFKSECETVIAFHKWQIKYKICKETSTYHIYVKNLPLDFMILKGKENALNKLNWKNSNLY
jgi:hypothetical protein